MFSEEKEVTPMNDAISRSASTESLNQHSYETFSDYNTTVEILNELPSIDAVPVVYGGFVRQSEVFFPNLRVTPLFCQTCRTTFFSINKEGKKFMCCPYCGARTDGEADG